MVLGVYYDTVNWTWSIKDDKLSIILNKLQDCIKNKVMSLRDIKYLCGKLIDIRYLCNDFIFHLRSLIIDSSMNGTDLSAEISLSQWTREDLERWKIALPINNGGKIPNPDIKYGPRAVRIYTDAAGGSMEYSGRRVGALVYITI